MVVTRSREKRGGLADRLRAAGARVIVAPAIALAPPRTWGPVDRAIERLPRYDVVVFSSANGVERFLGRLGRRGRSARDLAGRDIVAVGPATAEALRAAGVKAASPPSAYRAEGLVAMFRRRRLEGARVLFPRAAVARDLLPRDLRRRGALVDAVAVYRTLAAPAGWGGIRAAVRAGRVDLLTFASPSAVEHFTGRFRGSDRVLLRRVPAAVIGPITAAAARDHGLHVAVMPRDSTIAALALAVARFGRRRAVVD